MTASRHSVTFLKFSLSKVFSNIPNVFMKALSTEATTENVL